jgi:F-box-like
MDTIDEALSSLAYSRVQMDVKIDATTQQLHALRKRRNTFAPICRLPVETLSDIFMALIISLDNQDFKCSSPSSWIHLTTVCTHFLAVMVACPKLWTHIFLPSKAATEEMLRRSQSARLTIKSCYYWRDDFQNVQLALKRLENVG